ncbi:hypothetical protein Kisp02_30440 [Kineosporia sp. NBRC 101731]|nr:hypothetical protein Kisp02_30440 [Kineosporia sp. NBRC 101731]
MIANLFEWNWTSVSSECTDVLGPAGYGGVQVAPPQTSIKLSGSHPWYEVYQPAGYGLESRMGSEAQFKAMVTACRKAGVKVYVDAVINHMAGSGGTSYGGGTFDKYTYAGLYTKDDFHHQGTECNTSDGKINDYENATQVNFCELVGLSDLKTESTYVRGAIDGYLNRLIGFGVSGFRVDAGKHIAKADLLAIIAGLNTTADGEKPYVALEVTGGSGDLSPAAFTEVANVLTWGPPAQLKKAFNGKIATLKSFGESSGLPASAKSLTFVQNHDTERDASSLTYKDGDTDRLATQYLLAGGYGRAQVYASFTYSQSGDSPPSDAAGKISNTNCSDGRWNCLDRDKGVKGMIAFRNAVGTAKQANWYDDGASLIAFSRGAKGWTALNNGSSAKTQTIQTGLAAGKYCDLITGGTTTGTCSGTTITVGSDGKATVTVPAKGAVAITA